MIGVVADELQNFVGRMQPRDARELKARRRHQQHDRAAKGVQ